MSKLTYLTKKLGVAGTKKLAKRISDTAEYIINKTSLNPWDADELNKGEHERLRTYFQEKDSVYEKTPLERDVKTWSINDLNAVMKSIDYKYNQSTQKKVQSYFEWKYPGKQRLDATGRPY